MATSRPMTLSRPPEPGGLSPALLVRALGPGSMASLLKMALDAAYVALWAAALVLALGGLALLVALPFKPGGVAGQVNVDGRAVDVALLIRRGPQAAALVVAVELYLAALIVVFGRLRRVFETLIAGDPFRPENVRRLRQVGGALIGLEALGYAVRAAVAWLLLDPGRGAGVAVNLSGWFAILVVFVLAEVFREGARLRREAELTI